HDIAVSDQRLHDGSRLEQQPVLDHEAVAAGERHQERARWNRARTEVGPGRWPGAVVPTDPGRVGGGRDSEGREGGKIRGLLNRLSGKPGQILRKNLGVPYSGSGQSAPGISTPIRETRTGGQPASSSDRRRSVRSSSRGRWRS